MPSMIDAVPPPLAVWQSYYVLVGTAAAALTGLQFVVVAIVTQVGQRLDERTMAAFATPTIVHFVAVVMISALCAAPWPSLAAATLVLGATGLAGVLYTALVIRRTRGQTNYTPVMEDWIFHTILPLAAYATLAAGAMFARAHTTGALFAVAASVLVLLAVAIHNAWDTVTYVAARESTRASSNE